jgi:hypothetical protein
MADKCPVCGLTVAEGCINHPVPYSIPECISFSKTAEREVSPLPKAVKQNADSEVANRQESDETFLEKYPEFKVVTASKLIPDGTTYLLEKDIEEILDPRSYDFLKTEGDE